MQREKSLADGSRSGAYNSKQPGQSESNSAPATLPALTLPKSGGAIRGIGEKFTVNPVTGTGSLVVPIFTSPGRSGFGPSLSLSYNSGSGNSPFGFGWALDLPSVTRKTSKGLPQYRDDVESDVFIISDAEDLVPGLVQSAGQSTRDMTSPRTVYGRQYAIYRYRPRVEGLFARIERWVNLADPRDTFWRSISKHNVTTWYGKTAASRIADPADPSRVFSWLICETYDDKGNVIVYDYKADDSTNVDLTQVNERNRTAVGRAVNRYLKNVLYGNRTSYFPDLSADTATSLPTDWCFQLVLDYGEHDLLAPLPQDIAAPWNARPDPFSVYRSGFEVRTYRLCRRALMFHHFPDAQDVGLDCLVRSTDLVHAQPPATDRSHPFYSYLLSNSQTGYRRNGANAYFSKALPPVEYLYSTAVVDPTVRDLDQQSARNLPTGVDGRFFRWVDLDGEGLSGVLTEQGGNWFYKSNLSPINLQSDSTPPRTDPLFAPVRSVSRTPSLAALVSGEQQLMDLSGDGRLDLVDLTDSAQGYFERTDNADWTSFARFQALPKEDWHNPELRFVDLTGDGLVDLLISEGNAFRWYESLGTQGFGAGQRLPQAFDEEQGPRLVFSDGTESVFLADMSGDGLSDLVRIRNGEVCYWPNLGFGRFGSKVTMDRAPLFDHPDLFSGRRLRLADIDGSGTVDIIYLGSGSVQLYFNQSGNGWGEAQVMGDFPPMDSVSSVDAIDLLGNGTACLVWSSPLQTAARQPMRYIDLMSGQKPHLLQQITNNLGAETRIQYASSTRFYVADKLAGTPWVTRLPFPVQVVERVQSFDFVSRNLLVTRYAYHHGYFDGVEREFRGFGRVDEYDTEDIATLTGSASFPQPVNIDTASQVPPVLTKTWFHTGAYFGETRISRQMAHEYYADPSSPQLDDTILPSSILLTDGTRLPHDFSPEELREAARALCGSILRQEVYSLDNSQAADRPYLIRERDYTLECLQPQSSNPFGVFYVHARESIDAHYERTLFAVGGNSLPDPRIEHTLTLAVDPLGNVLQSASVAYGRRYPDPGLSPQDSAKQTTTLSTSVQCVYTNTVQGDDVYRASVLAQHFDYELLQVEPASSSGFGFDEIAGKILAASDGAHDIAFETLHPTGLTPAQPYRRLLKSTRTYYRPDDMGASTSNANALLPLGTLQSLALPGNDYKLAFTPGLISTVYQRAGAALLATPAAVLGSLAVDGGGYVDLDSDGNWWVPSGRMFFSAAAATPQAEAVEAKAHFYLLRRVVDPFGNNASVDYDDPNDLMVVAIHDAALNTATASNNYRVLEPVLLTDANGNRRALSFDLLGMVAGSAVMGKTTENLGDSLSGFVADLTQQQIDDFFNADDPHTLAGDLLGNGTTRVVADLDRFQISRAATPDDPTQWQPSYAALLMRETHTSDLTAGQQTRIQIAFGYSDGYAREIQHKIQAEPASGTTTPRWVGSGWTIYNNKGLPVRKYDPFFSALAKGHWFEFGVAVGFSPIACYDPLERVVATVHANHTYEKVVLDPWQQTSWDVNDTVTQPDPSTDPDVGQYIKPLAASDYLPTWYTQRSGNALGALEQDAANKAAAHANTPNIGYQDTLGRTFLSVGDDGAVGKFTTRVELDIQSLQRSLTDANGRQVIVYDYDMLGNPIHQASMEAAERWMLADVSGKPIRTWDARGHNFRSTYDSLRRLTRLYVRGTDPANSDPRTTAAELLVEKTVYGEGQANDTELNLRTHVIQHCDGAGILSIGSYDFKGNALATTRQFAQDYKGLVDWSGAAPQLEAQLFTSSTTYDALDRDVTQTAPDGSVLRPTYNAANLLETLSVNLQGSTTATVFINNIDYDAKGQRISIQFQNGATTHYTYDPVTLRLTQLTTTRPDTVQDLSYTYDPVGNITHIEDDAQGTVFFKNQQVEPSNDYTYDALYRLINATGREHLGQIGSGLAPAPTSYNDAPRILLPQPGDGNAMGTYSEQYEYDAVGNFLQYIHQGSNPANPGWSRSYIYGESSLLEPANHSNRLTRSVVSGAQPLNEDYAYDLHGNMTRMPQLQQLSWDFKDRLLVSQRQAVNTDDADGTLHQGERTYYIYDSSGQRMRKVTERSNGTLMKERSYLHGYEVYREYDGPGTTVSLERQSLHVMDDKQRIALVETRTQGNEGDVPQLIRYQFGNHIGSASLELDATAQIISYEEYYPYGSTSYQAGRSAVEVALKRYRYVHRERDEESGLGYHAARYYALWIGRWISTDPMGPDGGINLYEYSRSRPTVLIDPGGMQPKRQLWLAEQSKFTITPVATRTNRGISRLQRKALRGIGDAFGPKEKMHWGHPSNQTHGTTPAGQSPPLRPQPGSENSSMGATADKAAKADARKKGLFARDSNDIDVEAKKGKRWNAKSKPDPTIKEMADYESSIAKRKPPVRVPRAPEAPIKPSPHEQLELPFDKAPAPPATKPPIEAEASPRFRGVGKVVGGLGVAGMAGDVITDLHEGHYKKAAVETGVGAGVAFVVTKVPVLAPLGVMVSTISAYDDDVKEHANSAGGWVENHTGSRVLGAVTASAAATGESAFQGTFGTVGRGIGTGAAVLYIRATSDDYTIIPWKTQIWSDIFD